MNSISHPLPGEEIADLFRQALRREVGIVAVGQLWKQVYAGNVVFRIGGYQVVIFNDCDELDYVDSATAPDGRTADFDEWTFAAAEPVSLLTVDERMQLEYRLESAPAVVR